MANPAFSANSFTGPALAAAKASTQQPGMTDQQLEELYGRAAASPDQAGRMSYEDTIVKTLVSLAVVVVGAVVGFTVPILALPFALVGFVLALVNIFKKQPSAPLVLAYAAAQGVFVGGLSAIVQANAPGIIFQALVGTAAVFGVTLFMFANGKLRATKRATKIFTIAIVAYGILSLVNLVLQLTGTLTTPWGMNGADIPGTNIPFGLIIGPLAILLGAYSLVLDFTSVKEGVEKGAPRAWGWKAAFGLTLTILWLYVEILRLISIIRGN